MSEVDVDTGDTELHEVWTELQRTQDPGEREFLLERLAGAALDFHDFSDGEIPEDLHAHFEQLRRVREDYHLVAVRVGRFVARMMEDHETRARMTAHAGSSSTN